MRRRFVTMASVIALGLVTAACGGGDSSAGDTGSDRSALDVPEVDVADLPQTSFGECGDLFQYMGLSLGVLYGQTAELWADHYEIVKQSAPQEIRPQIELTAETFQVLADAMIAAGGDARAMAEANPDLISLVESVEDGEVSVALREISDYYEAECWDGEGG